MLRLVVARRMVLPLSWGEGRGEGECGARWERGSAQFHAAPISGSGSGGLRLVARQRGRLACELARASRLAIRAMLATRRPMALGFDQHHPGGTGAAPRLPNVAYHSNPSGIGRDARVMTQERRPAGSAGRLSPNLYQAEQLP